jgi:hypothetical protein
MVRLPFRSTQKRTVPIALTSQAKGPPGSLIGTLGIYLRRLGNMLVLNQVQ